MKCDFHFGINKYGEFQNQKLYILKKKIKMFSCPIVFLEKHLYENTLNEIKMYLFSKKDTIYLSHI